jgi:lipopolysaccharide/colanic/teichoic acid biosynthesis glycosyltransferase
MDPIKATSPQNDDAKANESAHGCRVDANLSRFRAAGARDIPSIASPAAARQDPFVVSDICPPDAEITAATNDVMSIPFWKRALDHTCIWLTLPAWLLVMAAIAAWIRFASPGPLLYRQERVGYKGRRFMILKFRTMHTNAETQTHEGYLAQLIQSDCPMTKLDCNDDRVIRGARSIRALGLDELPQIFNVIRGDMSLVGPRPCTPQELRNYKPDQRERINAPPGLTGYWQVNGKNKTTFTQMIAMDLFYAKNMSLWLDLVILLRTFPAIAEQVLESRLVRKGRSQIGAMLSDRFARLRHKILEIVKRFLAS